MTNQITGTGGLCAVDSHTVSSTRLASGSAGFLGGLRSVFGVEGSRTWQSSVAPGRGEFRTGLLHEGRRSGDAWTRSRAGPLGSGYTKKGERVSDDVFSPLRGKIASSVFVFAYRSHGKVKSTISLFYKSTKCSLRNFSSLMTQKRKPVWARERELRKDLIHHQKARKALVIKSKCVICRIINK